MFLFCINGYPKNKGVGLGPSEASRVGAAAAGLYPLSTRAAQLLLLLWIAAPSKNVFKRYQKLRF